MAGEPAGETRKESGKSIMSRNEPTGGVIPAILTPRDGEGRILWDRFEANVAFVLERGASGVCVNGATGEYASATTEERREAVRRARSLAGKDFKVVGAIGAAHWQQCLMNVTDAAEEGADTLLVPVPHFFPYQQDDIAEFYRQIASAASLPVLIYNLPQFAGGVELETALQLICEERSIAGIKDSSGSLEILTALTARPDVPSVRLLGNDAVLGQALAGGLCQGVISGVACVLPELIVGLFAAYASDEPGARAALEAHLDEYIKHLNILPVPWGLKVTAECRGLAPAAYSMPLSPSRKSQIAAFQSWFAAWWPGVVESTPLPVVVGTGRSAG